MRCRRARRLVFEFIDGAIDDAKRLELEKHLSGCAECEKYSSQITRSLDLAHRAPVETPGDNFAWKVRLRLNQERKAVQKNSVPESVLIRAWNVRYASAAVAAFALVVVAGSIALQVGVGLFEPKSTTSTSPRVVASDVPGERGDVPVSTDSGNERTGTTRGSTRPGLNWPELGIGIANRSVVSPVSQGPPALNASPGSQGAIDETPAAAALDLDSVFTAQINKLPPEERLQYLRERIRFLNEHLERYRQTPDR